MFCENCGVKQPDNALFCSSCGNDMGTRKSNDSVVKPAIGETVQSKPIPVSPRPTPTPLPPVQQQSVNQPRQAPRIDPLTVPLSIGSYLGMFILLAIPIVNFVVMCIWLFSSTTNKNKKNFAIALLLMTIIMIVISILLSGIIGSILYPLLQDLQYDVY